MTGIVTRGATFGGTSLVTLVGTQPRIVLRCTRGLDDLPRVRGRDTIIPATAGRTARNRVRDIRIIELIGFVAGTGATDSAQMTDFRNAIETLRALLDPTAAAQSLVIALEDAGTATITARPRNMLWGDDRLATFRALSVEFEAVGNDWVIA